MEAKFTKAPWLVRENDFIGDKLDIWHNDYSGVEQIPVASVEIGLNPLFDAEQKTNAKLIAAAPDLYEALDRVHKLISQFSESGFNPLTEPEIAEELFLSQGQRFDALKKARGEQP